MANDNKFDENVLQKLPSVDTLLKEPEFDSFIIIIGREVVVDSIRVAIDHVRQSLLSAASIEADEKEIYKNIFETAKKTITAAMKPYFRKVVNATGIILHTGLGRAVLPARAIKQIHEELSGYSLLQLSAETGKRSKRDECIEQLLSQLTGAEAATVVNNNAAATSIVLNTIAKNKEVIVSRGQLVEIGGSFRLPDVMAFSGAKLVEVGTTNKTHAKDYTNAITENTAAILRVHPSNYKIQGFSSEVPLDELVEIAHSNNLIMMDDVGAGALIDFSQFGFEPEPTLADSIRKGADIVTSSADKLIGASQGGIILGKTKLIEAVRKNQFARIVRVGKLTLAALEATLKLFLDEAVALREVPTLQMLMRKASEIAKEADDLVQKMKTISADFEISAISGFSQMGSGSLPTQNLVTTLAAVKPKKISSEVLAQQLRQYTTPVFARIQNDQVLFDPRTLLNGDKEIILKAMTEIFSKEL
ncbi:MAG: L-seryl-tRNA(Sec) selenium transferase [Sedimentisphaerales bacterium]|nr:L-seryl-tRNA(Sec) selenium transferase [Sedimentisphaerales bacterium]